MMKEVFSNSKECGNCPRCLSHYLAGRESCSDCNSPLEETQFRGKKRTLRTSPSALSMLLNPAGADDDGSDSSWDDDSFKAPIKWNDPMAVNIVGFVVCLMIVISMLQV